VLRPIGLEEEEERRYFEEHPRKGGDS
jgi:hypothetical protein